MEIEKRFELNGEIPYDLVISKMYIEQVYSSIADNKGTPDCRIRKTVKDDNSSYCHTVKYKTDDKNSRIELEQEINEDLYNDIFKIINKIPVKKNRYLVPINDGLFAEIDQFLDKNITIVEVEFPDEETMDSFMKGDKPSFIGDEITKKQSFSSFIFSELNKPINNVNIKFY